MEAKAINRYIGSSPRKMRLVIDLIRGMSVDEALHILHFSTKHASKVAEKVLRSAVANLQNKDGGGRLEPENMVVKTVAVDPGMSMKRVLPAPMGRAFRIRKRSHHLTIVVAAKQEALAPAKVAGRKKKEEPKPEPKKAGAAPKARKTDATAPKKKAEADDTK